MGAELKPEKGRLLFVFDLEAQRSLPLTRNYQYIGDGLAWSPEGDRVYYIAGGKVFVATTDGSGPTQVTHGATALNFAGAQNLALSPDGKAIVFVREEKGDVAATWKVNRDGFNLVRLSP